MTTMVTTPVVIKVGGSLLDLPDLASRLGPRVSGRTAVIAGGGPFADAVRAWQPRWQLTDAAAHDVAMRTLDVTAELIATQFDRAVCCKSPADVAAAWSRGEIAVVRPGPWFQPGSGWFESPARLPSGLLPKSWDVTSDTLAACVAVDLQAELVLLKSVDWPAGLSLLAAAEQGLVDEEFPRIAPHVQRIRWINLRTGAEFNMA
jgi:aspartokinase-like uncharacterized kinase